MLVVRQGDVFKLELELIDEETNQPFMLDNYLVRFTIRKKPTIDGELVLTGDSGFTYEHYSIEKNDNFIFLYIDSVITKDWVVGSTLYLDVVLINEQEKVNNVIYFSAINIDKRVSDIIIGG